MSLFTFPSLILIFYFIHNFDCHNYHDNHHLRRFYKNHKYHKFFNHNSDNLIENFKNSNLAALTEAHHHHLRHQHDSIPWPVKKEAVVEGDLILGGLMMVHERENSITCGPIMPQGGIQALEAMLFTLDVLNSGKHHLLSNITLGAHILDDCDKDTYGLEMAVDFIKGTWNFISLSQNVK